MEEYDFNVQMRKLASCFPTKMQDEKLAFIYNRFKSISAIRFEKTVEKLVETCKHMPSIADMLEIYHSLYPMSVSSGMHRTDCKQCDTFGSIITIRNGIKRASRCSVCAAGEINFGGLPL